MGVWSVIEGPRNGDRQIKACPEAGSHGVHDMSWSAMASMHRARHRDQAGAADDMAGMHRAHHRDGGPGSMMGGRYGDMMDGVDGDAMMGSRSGDMMDGRDGDDMMDGRDGDDTMGGRDGDDTMGGRDTDDPMGPGHMGR
ncbi:hypothetical protein N868_13085 [Cellulomonas carbonis T26]|uniref:Uncharacterized protein n=2 Tax=Cellulomonas carbonis TaxID=1386092 RepID=A0A0A0BUU7_9CELL|nr:hypothetical protein N868_13085 [Cellulomonas carbonis T26]